MQNLRNFDQEKAFDVLELTDCQEKLSKKCKAIENKERNKKINKQIIKQTNEQKERCTDKK